MVKLQLFAPTGNAKEQESRSSSVPKISFLLDSLQEDIFMFELAKMFQKLLPQNRSPAHKIWSDFRTWID